MSLNDVSYAPPTMVSRTLEPGAIISLNASANSESPELSSAAVICDASGEVVEAAHAAAALSKDRERLVCIADNKRERHLIKTNVLLLHS